VTIEQGADDSTVQYSGKGFVFWLWFPLGYDFVAFRETANA